MVKKEIFKAWAEINISNLKDNIREIRRVIGDKNVEILAVLKDDAYGHGIDIVAPVVIEEGIKHIGVATVLEGQQLRAINKSVNIIVFGCFFLENISYVFKYKLIPVVCSYDIASLFNKEAGKRKKKLDVQLMIDTGMGRVGVWHKQGVEFVKKIQKLKNINIQGICSHFSCADSLDTSFSEIQLERFNKIIESLEREGIFIPFKHIANSAGILNVSPSIKSFCNMARPGLALYGVSSAVQTKREICLKPVLSLKTWIVYLKTVQAGRTISYGKTYEASKKNKIATISIGYGDGYSRLLSNKGEVIIGGKTARISGVVTMDQTMVEVGHIPDVAVGDEVVLIGKNGNENISIRDVAGKMGTIPYEVLCSIGKRVERIKVK